MRSPQRNRHSDGHAPGAAGRGRDRGRARSGPVKAAGHAAWVLLAGSAVLAAAACFSEDPDPMEPLPAECRELALDAGVNPDAASVEVVGIRGFAFVPSEVTVGAGTRVVWVNCEPVGTAGGEHTSTSDEGLWNSGMPYLSRGQTFERVFDEVGTFPYHCIPHSSIMMGTVTVVES